MKTEFHFDYPTILANQAQPVKFAIRFVAELVGNARHKGASLGFDTAGTLTHPLKIGLAVDWEMSILKMRCIH
jgi:hypothetical protein